MKNERWQNKIYIPIWLDLLSMQFFFRSSLQKHLHSNMVRFIMTLFFLRWAEHN